MKRILRVLVIFSLTVLSACSTNEVKPSYISLVKATKVTSFSAFNLGFMLDVSGLDIPSNAMQYDADVYKVTYRTVYEGTEIIASGIVALPRTRNPVSMISFHHGTIVQNEDAPSQSTGEALALFAALASAGFIAVVPDYIGFGSSADILHPYYVEEYMASASIDMLKAAKELASNKELEFNEELFLTGYSEGGYATMAVHKSIEENGLDGFNLIASFPAAGGYDVKGMQEYVFSLNTYNEPSFLAYVSLAYQLHYQWTQPLTDVFNEPYASLIPGLFDGTFSLEEINFNLTADIPELLNNEFLEGIDVNPQYLYFVNALEENSLTDWAPTKKMFLYHGDADTTVPIENSVTTYTQFIYNGASSNTVEFIALPGATHSSGVLPYIEDLVPRLLSLSSVSN